MMAEEKLHAVSQKLQEDPDLNGRLGAANTLDDLVGTLNDAGVDISKAELLKAEASRILNASDADLEAVGGSSPYSTETWSDIIGCFTFLGCCD